MPGRWRTTLGGHRRDVAEAILEVTAGLVARRGLRSVTMAQIARATGIGRATLYRYFPSIRAILRAWHARQIAIHLRRLADVRDRAGAPGRRLADALEVYALIVHETRRHRDAELAALLHRDEQVARARRQLTRTIRDLVAEAARTGAVRQDVGADLLASYCLHALSAAAALPSRAAVRRLVAVTLAGLRPARS